MFWRKKPLTPWQQEQLAKIAARKRREDEYAAQPWEKMRDWTTDREAAIAAAAWHTYFVKKGFFAFFWALAIVMPFCLIWIWLKS